MSYRYLYYSPRGFSNEDAIYRVRPDEVAAAERVILALRLDEGVPAAEATQPPLSNVSAWAQSAGLLEPAIVGGEPRFRLTTRGRLLSNEVFARLI